MEKVAEKILTKSETKKVYVLREEHRDENGAQASIQIGKKHANSLIDRGILIEDEVEDKKQNYKFKESLKIRLKKGILDLLIDSDYDKDSQVDIIFTKKSDGKLDLKKTVNNTGERKWFSELYPRMTEEDIFVIYYDEDGGTIFFDYERKHQIQDTNAIDKLDKQIIYYGAPGTGKSFILNEKASLFEKNVKRVTFHPNFSYSDLIGVYKPYETGNAKVPISYGFIYGPLLKLIIDAFVNPGNRYLLIIEEINRANVSAVFGDIFQLLDRGRDGSSAYPIDLSNDILAVFDSLIYSNDDIPDERKESIREELINGLILPGNLFIWATMNSADQGVMPLDTAFKRRWNFQYIDIDESYDEEIFSQYYKIKTANETLDWNYVREKINDKLSVMSIPEDKLLGPYFISENVLTTDDESVTKAFKNKVLMYLFDDIGIHNRKKLFNLKKDRLSTVFSEFDEKGLAVLNLDSPK